jgi:hypothetical protein
MATWQIGVVVALIVVAIVLFIMRPKGAKK